MIKMQNIRYEKNLYMNRGGWKARFLLQPTTIFIASNSKYNGKWVTFFRYKESELRTQNSELRSQKHGTQS